MWNIHDFDSVPSTSSLLKERWLAGEARHGDVYVARHQTNGRGRLPGRQWIDTPGEALLMSILIEQLPEELLRSAVTQGSQPLQIIAAVATINGLRSLAKPQVESTRFAIKEPNDILLDGRKLAGILTEAVWQGDDLRALILGIGINVRQSELPPQIRDIATSLKLAGLDLNLETVREEVLRMIRVWFELQPAERTQPSSVSVT
jgi:BirA family transcriptional regulator, biotin operon repressor / biotin---[acetyl-CoA-carboxylase] ligase